MTTTVSAQSENAPIAGSLRRHACELDHLAPFLGVVRHEFAELARAHGHRHAAAFGQARLYVRVGEPGVQRLVESRHHLRRGVLGRNDAVPDGYLIAGHGLPMAGISGSESQWVAVVTPSARSLPDRTNSNTGP